MVIGLIPLSLVQLISFSFVVVVVVRFMFYDFCWQEASVSRLLVLGLGSGQGAGETQRSAPHRKINTHINKSIIIRATYFNK